MMMMTMASGVHISRDERPVQRGVLPVCDVRRVHGAMAGAALQHRLPSTNVRHPARHYGHRLPAHFQHHRPQVARLPTAG